MARRSSYGVNKAKVHKCSICGQKYTVHDSKNPNKDGEGKIFRFPNEWDANEIVAHRISHLELVDAKRLSGKFITMSSDAKSEFLDFVKDLK